MIRSLLAALATVSFIYISTPAIAGSLTDEAHMCETMEVSTAHAQKVADTNGWSLVFIEGVVAHKMLDDINSAEPKTDYKADKVALFIITSDKSQNGNGEVLALIGDSKCGGFDHYIAIPLEIGLRMYAKARETV